MSCSPPDIQYAIVHSDPSVEQFAYANHCSGVENLHASAIREFLDESKPHAKLCLLVERDLLSPTPQRTQQCLCGFQDEIGRMR
jgi:hypothetical protein